MQPAHRDVCAVEIEIESAIDDRTELAESLTSGYRQWIHAVLDWLDQYWDDPELRTGFWRSGW